MATFRMEDGTVVKTENAKRTWEETRDFNGHNWISRATGDQWVHESLCESRKGRYYIHHWSQWQGSRDWAEWISPEHAAAWLELNDKEIPSTLTDAADRITE